MPTAPLPIPANLHSSNKFGVFRPKQGPSGTWHWGIDIPPGSQEIVVAPESGEIVNVWNNDTTPPFSGYGPGGVLIRGDDGLFHLLAHLDPTHTWKPGQRVDEGDHIAAVARGVTPSVNWAAPHVHWEVRIKPIDSPATRKGNTLDPVAWLAGNRVMMSGAPRLAWWVWLAAGFIAYRYLQR